MRVCPSTNWQQGVGPIAALFSGDGIGIFDATSGFNSNGGMLPVSVVGGTLTNAGTLPFGAADATTSATGAAAAHTTATLTAGTTTTSWIEGFNVTTGAATAAGTTLVTVTGLAAGTLSYQYQQETGAGATLSIRFPRPLPASAVHTNVVVDVAATTNGGVVAVVAYGYTK